MAIKSSFGKPLPARVNKGRPRSTRKPVITRVGPGAMTKQGAARTGRRTDGLKSS